eukprot:Gregarina_sp_Poly_1__1984@NODE_151_length_12545_cov_99_072047_g134_i0_p6_GENE_NODE_151_length_12545_cov_99_072047_g134_i0NODE_151_length_12545_cov_99_072047_g134_i0_p6_ORF_typecomplete_len283_score40_20_NODE_151_length_12545_cov_99_072047_g134_i025873
MLHPDSGVEAFICCDRKRLKEFDAEIMRNWIRDRDFADLLMEPVKDRGGEMDFLTCYIPAVAENQFIVVVRGKFAPPQKLRPDGPYRYTDTEASVYVDGIHAASKSKQNCGKSSSFKMVFDGVRTSGATIQLFQFSKVQYDVGSLPVGARPSRENNQAGEIRVDIYKGFRASAVYSPVLRFCNQNQEKKGARAVPLNDSKALHSSQFAVTYGPEIERIDKRRRFDKVGRVCRFIFRYCDPRWIDFMDFAPPKELRLLESGTVITVDDCDEAEDDKKAKVPWN